MADKPMTVEENLRYAIGFLRSSREDLALARSCVDRANLPSGAPTYTDMTTMAHTIDGWVHDLTRRLTEERSKENPQ